MNAPAAWRSLGARTGDALAPVRQRWNALEPRQQRMIRIGGVLVLLVLAIAWLWLPAARERERLLARLPQMAAELAQMKQQAGEISQLVNSNAPAPVNRVPADSAQLQSLFGAAAKISIDRERGFRVVIARIAYAAWWDALAEAQSRHGLRMTALAMKAVAGGNREVSVEMVLTDPARASVPAAAATK